ncbi:MAG TPA: hypothetical protein VNL77_14895 [Roseiflexaceae bacterium]|nr:hypothetical protein [Roseiflexaceae bacterium]
MRTRPNRAQLRRVALASLGLGAGLFVLGALLISEWAPGVGLALGMCAGGLPLLAMALWFWALSRDRRAGIVVDSKGLLLNLGASSAFIAWDNIERVGVTWHYTGPLALGSRRQLGVALRDALPYIQSYEERVPAAPGPLGWGLRLARLALREGHSSDNALALHLVECRRRSGYDVLIPEELLGQPALFFAEVIEARRHRAHAAPGGRPAWAARPARCGHCMEPHSSSGMGSVSAGAKPSLKRSHQTERCEWSTV